LVGSLEQVRIEVNGGQPFMAVTGRTVHCWKVDGRWGISPKRYPDVMVKKHGVSGPIQDVFMGQPVLMVYGTSAGQDQAERMKMLDGIVTRLFGKDDGSGILRTGFQRKADDQVDDTDIAEKNLILVGTPSENRLLAKIADKLPVGFLDDGVRIGKHEYRGEGISLVMVYPNPLNPDRYILLFPENYWGDKVWDFPDYLVMKEPVNGQGRGQILAKGTFDAYWQLQE